MLRRCTNTASHHLSTSLCAGCLQRYVHPAGSHGHRVTSRGACSECRAGRHGCRQAGKGGSHSASRQARGGVGGSEEPLHGCIALAQAQCQRPTHLSRTTACLPQCLGGAGRARCRQKLPPPLPLRRSRMPWRPCAGRPGNERRPQSGKHLQAAVRPTQSLCAQQS